VALVTINKEKRIFILKTLVIIITIKG